MKKIALISASVVFLTVGGCSGISDSPDENEPVVCPVESVELLRPVYDFDGSRPLNEVAQENVGRANGFAAQLFRTIYNDKSYKDKKGNVCVSPASVFCTFAMMANGDDGQCRDEILEMLGYGKGTEALRELNVYANALLTETSEFDGATQCGFTNSIWHRADIRLLPDFTADIKGILGGMIFPTWIGDKAGMEAINRFVYGQTCGMIYPFLENPLKVDLAFLNTTYFKGAWETAFVNELTEDMEFHGFNGSKTKTPFMKTLENVFDYAEIDGIRCLRLPYKGNRYSMTLLQPLSGKPKDFDTMLQTLDNETIERYEKGLQQRAFILMMPKFETAANGDILECLKEMGIDKTCSQGLDKVSDMALSLSLFRHAVRIIVDEEGTEAGAASLGGLVGSSGTEYRPKEIKIDSPFIYMICDTLSGTVLFMGAITAF